MKRSLSATSRPALPRTLAATFVTLAVLFGVMAQQQAVAAPVGLGAKTAVTEAQPAASAGLVLVHHKGYGHKKRHFKRAHKRHHFKHSRHGGHRFKGHGFKKRHFKRHGHGFKRFRHGGHRSFRSFRHRAGHGKFRRYRY